MFSDCIVMLQKKHHDATQKTSRRRNKRVPTLLGTSRVKPQIQKHC